jgi:hypothetical protein
MRLALPALGALVLIAGCSDDPGTAPTTRTVTTSFAGLAALDPTTEGTYEGWVIDASGTPHSTGTFAIDGSSSYAFDVPIESPTMFVLTVEPPNDTDPAPSAQKILGGPFSSGAATLLALGLVSESPTANFAANPGTHVLLTPTTAATTDDDAGIWLLSPPPPGGIPGVTVTLPPLTAGWVYEGWIVFQPGTANQVAISYGKFTPQSDGTLTGRDSDAAGPLSGAPGDLMAGPPFPGGDFVSSNGGSVPGGLTVPVDFNGDDAVMGDSEWMHVISIEPAFDVGEAPLAEVPFQLKPFGNPFGDGGPTTARTIAPLAPLPTGTASLSE